MNAMPPSISSKSWSARTKRLLLIAIGVIVAIALVRLSEVLPILGVAVILAYLLTPLVTMFEKRVLGLVPLLPTTKRGIAVGLTYIVLISAFIILMLVVVPVLAAQIEEFGRRLPGLIRSLEQSIEHTLSEPFIFNGEPILINGEPFIPLDRLREITGAQHVTDIIQLQNFDLVGTTQSFLSSLTGPAFDFVGGALTAIINITFLLSMMFFLMRDGAQFVDRGVQLLPNSYHGDSRRLLYELGRVWNAYLRGQLTLAFFMGTMVFVIATALGLPNALILAMISFLLEFIPSIGSGLAIFPAALLGLTTQSTTYPFLEGVPFMVVMIVVMALLQNLEAYILVPRIMGGSLNLHPLAVIVGILAGASLAGVLGIILAAPAVASLRIFGQYIYGKLMDRDPFPPPVIRQRRPSPVVHWAQRRATSVQQGWETRLAPQIRQWWEARRNSP
jgi:predicted PurR-regulated permease PerM